MDQEITIGKKFHDLGCRLRRSAPNLAGPSARDRAGRDHLRVRFDLGGETSVNTLILIPSVGLEALRREAPGAYAHPIQRSGI